ncbi:MAG: HAD family phosphatase, partial [Clostridia bacterium]|nr:HAD family phosphatase [Clostridia bacterium]
MKGFIFDMDGTLFDTEILTQEALRAVSKKYGECDDVDEFYPTTCGTNLPDAKLLYKKFFGEEYPFESRREEMRKWIRSYIDKNGIPVKKGAIELLNFLKEHGYKIAIATSSTRISAEGHIKTADFEKYFDVIV